MKIEKFDQYEVIARNFIIAAQPQYGVAATGACLGFCIEWINLISASGRGGGGGDRMATLRTVASLCAAATKQNTWAKTKASGTLGYPVLEGFGLKRKQEGREALALDAEMLQEGAFILCAVMDKPHAIMIYVTKKHVYIFDPNKGEARLERELDAIKKHLLSWIDGTRVAYVPFTKTSAESRAGAVSGTARSSVDTRDDDPG